MRPCIRLNYARRKEDAAAGLLRLVVRTYLKPHPDKVSKGGEDAFFASHRLNAFGVADGVGGYSRDGIDTGLFSRAIMKHTWEKMSTDSGAAVLEREGAVGNGKLCTVMEGAFDGLRESNERKGSQVRGGCTMLIGRLCPSSHILDVLNLGDSGLIVFRSDHYRWAGRQAATPWPRIVCSTQPQNSFFNCPFQVSHHEVSAPETYADVSRAADEVAVRVRPGDIVVAASDGLFDNLFEVEIQAMVARSLQNQLKGTEMAGRIAEDLGSAAHSRGGQPTANTPFARRAAMEGLFGCEGGKLDDVAIVVAVVESESNDCQSSDEHEELLQNWTVEETSS